MNDLFHLCLNLACVVRVSTKSFQSRTQMVPSHDPHIVTDFHDNGVAHSLGAWVVAVGI